MAGVVTHVYVAMKLLEEHVVSVKDTNQYILGSIAPDAIMSKEQYQRDDKKASHLRDNISSDRWYQEQYRNLFNERLQEFYNEHVNNGNEFELGYLIHLLTDQAFHFSFRDDIVTSLKEKGLSYKGTHLRDAIIVELDTVDYELLKENEYIKDVLQNSKTGCSQKGIDGLISPNEICRNFEWIEKKYFSKTETKTDSMYYSYQKRVDLLNHVINHVKDTLMKLRKKSYYAYSMYKETT